MRLAVNGGVGINESVPVSVGLSEESVAADGLVVRACVGGRWVTTSGVLSRDRPSSLSDDNWLALGGSDGNLVGVVEQRRGVVDGVVLRDLEVRECVHAEEIGLVNDGGVGAVPPHIPGIDVSDWNRTQCGA